MGLFKPLLTKEERKSLSKDERQDLRGVRRDERRAAGGGLPPFVEVAIGKVEARAKEMILDLAHDVIPGRDKMGEVLDSLAVEADELLVWTFAGPVGAVLEAADGVVLTALVRLVLRPLVQRVYDRLESEGLVE